MPSLRLTRPLPGAVRDVDDVVRIAVAVQDAARRPGAIGHRARSAHRAGGFLPRINASVLGDLAGLVERFGDVVGRIVAGALKLTVPFVPEGG